MRFLFLIYIILFAFIPVTPSHAQGYTGIVKNDSAFIPVKIAAFNGWEEVSAQWGVSIVRLQQINPSNEGITIGTPAELLIPVSHLLRNETCEGCAVVYHSVGKSEGLYRIGKWYGNQPVAILKARNGLRSDALKPGQQIMVGYILTPVSGTVVTPGPAGEPNKPANTSTKPDSVAAEIKPLPKPPPPRKILAYTGEGIFAPEFSSSPGLLVKKSGKASSFKSESGWTDGRFYLLESHLKPGTVVKITNASTGQFLYAKVVGPLPDIRQNEGLSLRLSSAAAAMLGYWEEDGSFDLFWEY